MRTGVVVSRADTVPPTPITALSLRAKAKPIHMCVL